MKEICDLTHAIILRRIIYKTFPVYKDLDYSSLRFEL